MNDLIRAGALLTNEDEFEKDFDESVDSENMVDEDGGDDEEDTDMGGWEN